MKNKLLLFFGLSFTLFTSFIAAQNTGSFPQKEINDFSASILKQIKSNSLPQTCKSIQDVEHSVIPALRKFSGGNIFKSRAPEGTDTISIGGDTLIVGYTLHDTLRITGNWTHIGPVIVFNDGVLIFDHANATIVGDIYVFGHGKAFSDSSSLYLPQQYLYQRSIVVVQNGYLNFANTSFNYGGLSHGFTVGDSASVFLSNIHNNDYTTTGMNGHASININGNNLTGEFIISDYVSLHLRHATNALLWHQFPDTALVNHSFPNGTTVNSYHFNKTSPGISGIEYNVQVDTSYNIQWSLMPENGSDITISNSTVRAIGLWFMGTDSCTVSGLVDNSSYSNFIAPLSDRNLHFINSSVQTWSLYPMQNSVVNLSGSIVGEIGTEGNSKLTGTNYMVDGSGGYCWSSDNSFLINANSSATCYVRSEKTSIQLFAYSTESNGVPTAIGRSVLMVVQSAIPQDPIAYEGSCVWNANISQPASAYVDSMVPVLGTAFIDKTAISPWMDFGYYRLRFQKSGDSTWTDITNPIPVEVRNNQLATWNTHGLVAGSYILRLILYDNWTDSVEAIKGVNLLPVILLSVNETAFQDNISVFPNPATDKLSIILPERSNLQILNIQGRIIKTMNIPEKETSIDITDLAKGVYIIKVWNDEGMGVKRFVKE